MASTSSDYGWLLCILTLAAMESCEKVGKLEDRLEGIQETVDFHAKEIQKLRPFTPEQVSP